MLNLSEILIRQLIKELIEEELIPRAFIIAPQAKKPTVNNPVYGRPGMGKVIPPRRPETYTLQNKSNQQINKQPNNKLSTITQRFEKWVNSQDKNKFKTISDLEKEYLSVESPTTSSERAELVRAIKEKWGHWTRYQ